LEKSMQNDYMQQVMANKAEVEQVLSQKRRASSLGRALPVADVPAVEVRITGALWWRSVIVPPNAFVVHTRQGHAEPLHIGMGISFRYNPRTDAFLVVPAAMQTIIINASCISRERQGVLVQGYVQWVIDDFARAYRRLDFSDVIEPMKVVNVQLREQAEATLKDAVATMSIDEVLADKQSIIQELTRRLRAVAEGGEGGDGLGLRIVTVQIKEAVVSSAKLWTDLQLPFRAERRKTARLAELDQEALVLTREDEAARHKAALEIARQAAVERLRAEEDATAYDRRVQEAARRDTVEAELAASRSEQQRTIATQEAEVARLKARIEIELEQLAFDARSARTEREIALEGLRQAVANDVSPGWLRARLIERLPEIARQMPRTEKATTVHVGGMDGLAGLVQNLIDVLEGRRSGGSA
jgi:flotillin